jgi:tryptophan synthase beta chain
VLETYAMFRPTPLIYASCLKKSLDTPAHIFYKYEGAGPMGSHKSNTAIMQVYLAAQEGIETLVTETGAGQWGSALAHAGALYGVKVKVFMVRVSYRQKPGRRILMELFGATVAESPSPLTEFGKTLYEKDPDHPGSLGIAISEALELAVKSPKTKYSLGSVLDSVLMHQTVIGLEADRQMAELGAEPDIVIGCVGGGSNFGGIALPFYRTAREERRATRFVAVEPTVCPSLTRGEFRYDFGDTAETTPLLRMHTLGHDFMPPPIHAGGLRYHGMAPIVSRLVEDGVVDPVAYDQLDVFASAVLFARTEGIIPAPETAHAVHAAVEIARECAATGEKKTILIGFSGHGHFDMGAYSAYLSGELAQAETYIPLGSASGESCASVTSRLYC